MCVQARIRIIRTYLTWYRTNLSHRVPCVRAHRAGPVLRPLATYLSHHDHILLYIPSCSYIISHHAHILSYRIMFISYYISHHARISYRIMLISYYIASCSYIISHHMLTSHHIASCPYTRPRPGLSNMRHVRTCRAAPYRIVSHVIAPCRVLSYHMTSHHIVACRSISIASHRIPRYNIL